MSNLTGVLYFVYPTAPLTGWLLRARNCYNIRNFSPCQNQRN